MKICVWGTGYVGAVTTACLAESGHHVTAVDVDPSKIAFLNEGKSPIVEKDLGDLLSRNVKSRRIKATLNGYEAMAQSAISLICVGTPSSESGAIDCSYIEQVALQIGDILKEIESYHIVVVRSTILPGTMEKIIVPILEERSQKKVGIDFGVGYNPEFLREGSAVEDYFNPTQIVVGAINGSDAYTIMSIYEGIDAPRSIVSIKVAEAVKYVSNIWRAYKISFANEMGSILKITGVDVPAVMQVFKQDVKINMGPSFLNPGFAFGGSCLPKDIRAMRAYAKENKIHTDLLGAILKSNKEQIEKALRLIHETVAQKILLLGLTFKPYTDDLRESPYVVLARRLIAEKKTLDIVDDSLKSDHQDITHTKNNIYGDLMDKMKTVNDIIDSNYDVIILGHATPFYKEIINDILPKTKVIALSYPGEGYEHFQGLNW